jgi:hypothetical protein
VQALQKECKNCNRIPFRSLTHVIITGNQTEVAVSAYFVATSIAEPHFHQTFALHFGMVAILLTVACPLTPTRSKVVRRCY